jgi:hypothetical protein
MRRLLTILVVVVFFLGLGAETGSAKLSRGDQAKLKKFLADFLDRFAPPEKRDDALQSFSDFFADRRRSKSLKDVEELGQLLTSSITRSRRKDGFQERELDLADIGVQGKDTKFKLAVSVPKGYQWSQQAPAWPLILCLPDRGQTATQFLDTYWKADAVRDAYIIAVIDCDYSDIKEEKQKEVKEDGKVTLEKVVEEVPFTWDSTPALHQFWGGFVLLMQREYKVDPNRVILDGAGFGSTGTLRFGAGGTWRFSGLIHRGGELDSPLLQNLAYIPVLVMPYAGASEGAAKTIETLQAVEGSKVTQAPKDEATGTIAAAWDCGKADQGAELLAWLETCRRQRYPLPSRWVSTAKDYQLGYWFSITGRFDGAKPAELAIDADRSSRRVNIESKNVSQFTLFLNDLLVDMDKPFEVYVNGEKVWEGQKERSAEQLLTHAMIRAPADPGAIFTNKIHRIEIAAPPEQPKEEGEDKEEGESDKDEEKR